MPNHTNQTSLTIRLNDDRNDKLNQIKERRGLTSKNEAVRRLIDDAADQEAPSVSALQEQINALQAQLNDGNTEGTEEPEVIVEDTLDPQPARTRNASEPGEGEIEPASTDGGALAPTNATDEEVMVVADGGSLPLSAVSRDSETAKLDPFDPDVDYATVIPQNMEKRRKAIRFAFNHVHEEMGKKSLRRDEVREIIDSMFRYNERSLDSKVEVVIERGDVLPHLLEDPKLRDRVDEIAANVYGSGLEWADFNDWFENGRLPTTLEECMGAEYHNLHEGDYYLDAELYQKRVEKCLEEMEEAVNSAYESFERAQERNKKVRHRHNQEEQYRLLLVTYRHMLEVVDRRQSQVPGTIVDDPEERFRETVNGIHGYEC